MNIWIGYNNNTIHEYMDEKQYDAMRQIIL